MAQVYNPQAGKMMQIDPDLADHMRQQHYFTTSHTGGGCFAWERATEDKGGYIWITNEDGVSLGVWEERDNPVWIVGRYNADGDFLGVGGCSLANAIKLAGMLRAPVAGEQTNVNLQDYRGDF